MLQDPLSEAVKAYPEGFCGRYHSLHGWEKQRAGRHGRKCFEADKERDVEQKGLMLSIIGGGKEGKTR